MIAIYVVFVLLVVGIAVWAAFEDEIKKAFQTLPVRINRKRSPDLYLYKRLKKGDYAETICWDFISIFWGEHFRSISQAWGNPDALLPEFRTKRDVCINGLRFMLGIVEADEELANRRKSVVDAVLSVLTCRHGLDYDGYHRDMNYEDDKIFIGEYQLLKTVKRHLGFDEYTFRDADNNVFVITNDETAILLDENLMNIWKETKYKVLEQPTD